VEILVLIHCTAVHPGVEATDLVHYVHNVQAGKRQPYPNTLPPHERNKIMKLLCHNCGWNTRHESHGDYTSRLKVFYLRDNCAIWELGPAGSWLLKDEANTSDSGWKKDYTVQQFLREKKLNIPLVEMHRFGGADEKFHFTMMSRAKGKTMAAIWETLTQEQQTDVYKDLQKHIKQWRQITSPHMGSVDGSELRDALIGNCTGFGCIKTGRNEEEWLENLTPAIRKGILNKLWLRNEGWAATQKIRDAWIKEADEKVTQLKANFPRGGPYVLTHGDLHGYNIMVSDDNEEKKFKVSAIIDWELAGFYPWWVEALRHRSQDDSCEILGKDTDIFHPGYDPKDLRDILKPVLEVQAAWHNGGYHGFSKHGLDCANVWYRKPFCACKPYDGEIQDRSMGWNQEHMDIFNVDSTDSEDDEPDEHKKFDKSDRDFMRWFKEISISK